MLTSLLQSVLTLQLVASVATVNRPIILYHGLGGSCCSEGMDRLTDHLTQMLNRNVTIFKIMIGDSPQEDRRRSYFDDTNQQVRSVCEKLLKRQPEDGYDAIGFSQGGLLMRAVVTRCEGLRVRRLITLGSPHVGVSAAPGCDAAVEEGNRWCRVVKKIIDTSAYSPLVRNRVIPAQYYRDPDDLKRYLRYNRFLSDINQESKVNEDYKRRLKQLERFVLYKFSDDTVLEPQDTAWFGHGNPLMDQIRNRTGFQDMLMDDGRVYLKTARGKHMEIAWSTLKSIAHDLQ